MAGDEEERQRIAVGLCATCKHVQRIISDRDSTFYLCTLSATDPRSAKYPRLPVLACSGYEEDARRSLGPEEAGRIGRHVELCGTCQILLAWINDFEAARRREEFGAAPGWERVEQNLRQRVLELAAHRRRGS